MSLVIPAPAEQRRHFLCICEGGNVRSVGLAWALKQRGHDAIAVGWRFVSPPTLKMLCEWADYIVVMQRCMGGKIPREFQTKGRVVDVGEDSYGNPFHPNLQGYFEKILMPDWQAKGWTI